jgi:hypothetical protein
VIIVATRQQARSMQYKSQPEATVIATTMFATLAKKGRERERADIDSDSKG